MEQDNREPQPLQPQQETHSETDKPTQPQSPEGQQPGLIPAELSSTTDNSFQSPQQVTQQLANKYASEDDFLKSLSDNDLEELTEIKDMPGYKVLELWREYQISKLALASLNVEELHITIISNNQEHTKTKTVLEQIRENQGMVAAINNERTFIRLAAKRYNKSTQTKVKS